MYGRPANQARKCLIRRSRVRTRAGLGVGWQVLDGLVQTFPRCRLSSKADRLVLAALIRYIGRNHRRSGNLVAWKSVPLTSEVWQPQAVHSS
jgi:hypothetical protein